MTRPRSAPKSDNTSDGEGRERIPAPYEAMATIRSMAGLSMGEMAKVLGLKSASTYQYHELRDGFKGAILSRKIVKGLADAIREGRFPLTERQIVDICHFDVFQHYKIKNAEETRGVFKLPTWELVPDTEGAIKPSSRTVMLPTSLIRALTNAEAEELLAVRLLAPNLLPSSTYLDYLILDLTRTELEDGGLYALISMPPSPVSMSFWYLKDDNKDSFWLVPAMYPEKEGVSFPREMMLAAKSPVYGRVIWQGRSLIKPLRDIEDFSDQP